MERLGSLTLIVKAPNQRIEDQRVACDRTWTVKQLKEHLSAVHPEKPRRDEQKLVYFGKLLKDEASLQEVLTQESYEDAHTVHLVCPSQSFNEAKPYVPRYTLAQPTQGKDLRQRRVEPQTSRDSTQPPQQSAPDYTQQWCSNWAQMSPTSTAANQMTAQQQLWMRMYQQQMAHYSYSMMHQYMHGQPAQPASAPVETASSTPAAPEAAPPAEAAQPAANAEDDVVRMNAQGGMDADEGQHDWMDTLYLLFRFTMLMLLLFFNTTLGRFAIVIAVGGFFYLAQGNMFRIYRRRPVEQELPGRPQPQNEQNQAENQNNENNERDNVGGQGELNNNTAVAENTSTWMDGVKLVITFIVTFFTSIIPQNPAAALQN